MAIQYQDIGLLIMFVTGLALITEWVTDDNTVESFSSKDYFPDPVDTNALYDVKEQKVNWDNVEERAKHPVTKRDTYIIDEHRFDASNFAMNVKPYDCEDNACYPIDPK
jgi:hypothetical protein